MLFEEQLTALGGQNLINFLLRDDIPCPEILGEENCPPEDCSMSELAHLDGEVDDLLVSMLSPSEDDLEELQECLLADSDSSISEHQHVCYSPGSNFDGSRQSSDTVHIDHNYFSPMLENMSSDISGGDPPTELGMSMDSEGTSMAAKHSSGCPIPVAVNAGPQLVPGSVAQSSMPELVLSEAEMQILEKSLNLLTYLPLNKAEEHLQKNTHQKHSAQDSHGSDINMDCMANRVAACTAKNYELGKKVQLLQKQNLSLLDQLQEAKVSETQSTTETTAKDNSMVLLLSVNVVVSTSLLSLQSEETQSEVTVLTQQISEFADNMAVDVQQDTALDLFLPDSEGPLMSISVTRSLEQEQSQTPQHCANEKLPLQPPASCDDILTPCQARTNGAVLTDN